MIVRVIKEIGLNRTRGHLLVDFFSDTHLKVDLKEGIPGKKFLLNFSCLGAKLLRMVQAPELLDRFVKKEVLHAPALCAKFLKMLVKDGVLHNFGKVAGIHGVDFFATLASFGLGGEHIKVVR